MSDKKVKLKAIIEVVYDADPDSYGTDEPEKMAEIDADNLNNGDFAMNLITDLPFTARVEVVQ